MNTQIISFAQTGQIPQTLRLSVPTTQSFSEICAHALEKLGDILAKHENENDPLSLSILNWVRRINAVECQTDEEFMNRALESMSELVYRILIDPIFKTPLHHPVLIEETGWTCESTFVEASHLHLNGRPVSTRVHQFALEILQWARPLIVEEFSINGGMVPESKRRAVAMAYQLSAQQRLTSNHLNKQLNLLEQTSLTHREIVAHVMRTAEIRLDNAEQRLVQERREVVNRMETMEKAHEAKSQSQTNRIQALNQNLEETGKACQELQTQNGHLANEVKQLRESLRQTAMQNEQLNGMLNKKRNCLIQ